MAPGRQTLVTEHNIEGGVQTQIIPDLYQRGDYTINNKKRQDCFMGTDPNILLQTLKVDTTVLVDINTNTCFLNTAFTAANSCFEVIAISDCVPSRHGENLHTFALQNISRCLGWVLTAEECTEKILAFKTDTRGHLGKQ